MATKETRAIALKEQITVTTEKTVFIVRHVFTGKKTIAELYEDMLTRKLQAS